MFSYVFMKILEGRPHSYDRLMHRADRGRVRKIKEAIAAEIPPGARALEIGCATGELAEIITGLGATVQGFDLSPAMIAAARHRIKRHRLAERLSQPHWPDSHRQSKLQEPCPADMQFPSDRGEAAPHAVHASSSAKPALSKPHDLSPLQPQALVNQNDLHSAFGK